MKYTVKILVFVLLLTTMLYACNNQKEQKSGDLNLHVDSMIQIIQISSGQFVPATHVELNGSGFDLAMRGADTVYLGTRDERFRTPEGYSVGTKYSQLGAEIQKNFQKEDGFLYYYVLPSGWALGICTGSSCTDSYPTEESQVKVIFKRK